MDGFVLYFFLGLGHFNKKFLQICAAKFWHSDTFKIFQISQVAKSVGGSIDTYLLKRPARPELLLFFFYQRWAQGAFTSCPTVAQWGSVKAVNLKVQPCRDESSTHSSLKVILVHMHSDDICRICNLIDYVIVSIILSMYAGLSVSATKMRNQKILEDFFFKFFDNTTVNNKDRVIAKHRIFHQIVVK